VATGGGYKQNMADSSDKANVEFIGPIDDGTGGPVGWRGQFDNNNRNLPAHTVYAVCA
jgi:hypothetical protein